MPKVAVTTALFEYWDRLRAGRLAPRRSEIVPRDVKDLLPYMFILEQFDHRLFRYRLAGTRLCEWFAGELRGLPAEHQWTASSAAELLSMLEDVTAEARVGIVECSLQLEGSCANAEVMLLPLARDDGLISRVLGATYPYGGRLDPFHLPIRRVQLKATRLHSPSVRQLRQPDTPDVHTIAPHGAFRPRLIVGSSA